MSYKKYLMNYLIIIFTLWLLWGTILGTQSGINELMLYLADYDIIMTQNTKDSTIYEGYDTSSRAKYKVVVNEAAQIKDFSVEIMDTNYERLDFNKILGLKWFIEHHLEKNDNFLKDIHQSLKDISEPSSSLIDIGEWKVSLLIFPLEGGKMNISLHFIDDASQARKDTNKNKLASLKSIYKELGYMEAEHLESPRAQLSYKLPYYKLNPDESMYYHSFFNHKGTIYKIQFIYYKNGYDFTYEDVPQLKQIIHVVTKLKNYPLDKLNIQFNHLKEELIQNKAKNNKERSSWDYEDYRTIMDLERYENRDQCRIKITIHLVKK